MVDTLLSGGRAHATVTLLLVVLGTGLLIGKVITEATWLSLVEWTLSVYGAGGAVSAYRDAFNKGAAA